MTSRQAGRRISTIAAEQKRRSARGGARQAGWRQDTPVSARERYRLVQLVACGMIFVLLVAAKLLLPAKMTRFNEKLSDSLRRNIDVQAVFSAAGRALSGEEQAVGEVYQAVFHPQNVEAAAETAAQVCLTLPENSALEELWTYRTELPGAEQTVPAETETADAADAGAELSTLAYVLYSDKNLPENVSLEQKILDFAYCTPVSGQLSSSFGYREHPVEGEERFHYGVDLAADTGTAVSCFADGTVTAVGESSSYGKYCIVSHQGGYATLYAHCSRITASSGAAVKEGEKIAEVGKTGIATGPHLHFELHQNGTYLNPIYYVSPA